MPNSYEVVSVKSFFMSKVGQNSKISNLSITGPRKHFHKVQYVLN